MKKRFFLCLLCAFLLCGSSHAAEQNILHWVDFQVDYRALQEALEIDVASQGEEKALSWIEILALTATYTGGSSFPSSQIQKSAELLRGDQSPKEFLGKQYKYYAYYYRAYTAVLGGLVGHYAIEVTDPKTGDKELRPCYGLKAFSPIAAGYSYSHYADFGKKRSYGFSRPHLGNDLMGSAGTPIIAVESGTVEALGWNQYGGWRIGIRSDDTLRYYYYAHLQKDQPYAEGLEVGKRVEAGDVIGFMGRTGYSVKENVNNIDTVHLHFGLQLVFDESQKECDSEIWVDVYDIVRLLASHRSSVQKNPSTGQWERIYPYTDLDRP